MWDSFRVGRQRWSPCAVRVPDSGQNGILPEATLLRDANGNLYGTADFGGTNNSGTIFKLTP